MQITKLINFPRNIYLNIKLFGFRIGLKTPIYFTNNIKMGSIYRGGVQIHGNISRFMIEIGEGGSKGIAASKGYFSVERGGVVEFHGHAYFAKGCVIRIDSGKTCFGNNFNANKNCVFWSSCGLEFGSDVLLGYNDYFRDDDGHMLVDDQGHKNIPEKIVIGNHVWVSSNVSMLKGSKIPDDCVVGYGTCVTKYFDTKNSLIVGVPGKVVKQGIAWKK